MSRRSPAALLLVAVVAACHAAPPPRNPQPVPYLVSENALSAGARAWVQHTLDRLTLRQKVGQMIMPWLDGGYLPAEGVAFDSLAQWVQDYGIGGVVVSIGPPLEIAQKLNRLQRLADVPLLVATDMEHGPGMRLHAGVALPYGMDLGGGTRFPPVMGLGATGDERLAYEMGRVTAEEARAVGIQLSFSPVVDVNNNPANPIINTRSYGEDPQAVARMAAAQIRGMQDNGLMATAKHFPGHGDTNVDSHIALPRLDIDLARADTVELVPFRRAIATGVTAVMSAHIAFPAITGDSLRPATLSPKMLTGLLQDSLGFHGLIVTDALNMGAIVSTYGAGDAAVMAVKAGADVLLMPEMPAALDAVVAAVHDGDLAEARIDRSVRKLLVLKARAGLERRRTVDVARVDDVVGAPEHRAIAQEIAQRSITVARDRERLLPLAGDDSMRVLSITYSDDVDPLAGVAFNRVLRQGLPALVTATLPADPAPATLDSLLVAADSAGLVLFSPFVRVRSSKGTVAVDSTVAAFVEHLVEQRPTIVTAFGNPYIFSQFPDVGTYVLAWGQDAVCQDAAAHALLGDAPVDGRLPISIPPYLKRGTGIQLGARLARAMPALVGMDSAGLARVDDAIGQAIIAGVTPGAALAIGRHGRLVRLRGYGRLDPAVDYGPVTDSTLYDLASLTKVIATTESIMVLVDQGRISLDDRVQRYIPEWNADPRESTVTIRDLLLHRAGLPAYEPLWRELRGKAAYIDRIAASGLDYAPRTKTVYSDFGFILLGTIVERVSGMPLDVFAARNIFEPLGLRDTGFNPLGWTVAADGRVVRALGPSLPMPATVDSQANDDGNGMPAVVVPPARSPLAARIAPTEVDTVFRHTHVHGVVHDENAFAMGGVAGHAGLFSSARDLAVVAQMLLDHGAYAGVRIFSAAVVDTFTHRFSAASTRALGWDTPGPESSAGDYFSASSFGHTGFTGTSIWIDPERDLFVVLLTNRVDPTRAEQRIGPLRRQVHDLVEQAITDMPVTRREDAEGG
jgi:beta-N-acetylhexosaminidase